MFELCTIGHITLDKIKTTRSVKYMPGGTAFYFSKALNNLDISYILITAVAEGEQYIIDDLRKSGIEVIGLQTEHTVYFENIYGENQDHREQNVLNTASPFTPETLPDISARIYHLGPLLCQDISIGLFEQLAEKGIVSLDVQGLLRYTKNRKVHYKDWADKETGLKYVSILKANEFEMEVLAGTKDVKEGAKYLAGLGVKEVVITCGSNGSLIYAGEEFYNIPALKPTDTIDTTGCGDTYMAGYLYQKSKGADIEKCGLFGAAMATLKIQSFGPFTGDAEQVYALLKSGTSF